MAARVGFLPNPDSFASHPDLPVGVGYAAVAPGTADHQVFLVSVPDVEDVPTAVPAQFVAVTVVRLPAKAVVATAPKDHAAVPVPVVLPKVVRAVGARARCTGAQVRVFGQRQASEANRRKRS